MKQDYNSTIKITETYTRHQSVTLTLKNVITGIFKSKLQLNMQTDITYTEATGQ